MQSTAERIMDAALELVSKKGYKAATTKAIAEHAGVNEVTLFRHFGNKRGLLKAIIQKFSQAAVLETVIYNQVSWELEEDLCNFSIGYQNMLLSIKEFILIGFKESGEFPEIDEEVYNIPSDVKKVLVNYLQEMKQKGKLIDTDVEAVAMSLIYLNFGAFISRIRMGNSVTQIPNDQILRTSISIFSRGLTP